MSVPAPARIPLARLARPAAAVATAPPPPPRAAAVLRALVGQGLRDNRRGPLIWAAPSA